MVEIIPLKKHDECFIDGKFSSDMWHDARKAHIRTLKKTSGLTLVELRIMATIKIHLHQIKSAEYKIWNYEGPRRDFLGTAKFKELDKLQAKGLVKRGERRYSLADFFHFKGKRNYRHHEYFWTLTDNGWQFFEQYPELAHPFMY